MFESSHQAKNQMLEVKLENQELKSQNRALKEESDCEALKMKDAEEKAQIAKNEVTALNLSSINYD
jgi:hypothetical protein